MLKLERQMTNGVWYEVMLSPFRSEEDIQAYLKKYSPQYPVKERTYRISHKTSGTIIKEIVP